MLGKMFRLIDPDNATPTALYHVMQKLFSLRGLLTHMRGQGGPVFHVDGPVGSGCVPGGNCNYWHIALQSGDSVSDVPYLKWYAVLNDDPLAKRLSIIVLNFAPSAQDLSVVLSGSLSVISSTTWQCWQVSAPDWNGALSVPQRTQRTVLQSLTPIGRRSQFGMVPARSATIFELDLAKLSVDGDS